MIVHVAMKVLLTMYIYSYHSSSSQQEEYFIVLYSLYKENKYRYTPVDGLPKAQSSGVYRVYTLSTSIKYYTTLRQ